MNTDKKPIEKLHPLYQTYTPTHLKNVNLKVDQNTESKYEMLDLIQNILYSTDHKTLYSVLYVDNTGYVWSCFRDRNGCYECFKQQELWENTTDGNLTHSGRVKHICVSKIIIIGSDNGLSPGRRQAIWINAGILLTGSLGINFSEILIEINTFTFKNMDLKMSSAKWRLFRLDLNELTPGQGEAADWSQTRHTVATGLPSWWCVILSH